MTSKVDVCNAALANIHAGSINSLNEASIEAQYCTLKFDFSLKLLLRMAEWGFARKQDPLALTTDSLMGWLYVYQHPSDCLRINHLISQIQSVNSSTPNLSYRPYYGYNDNELYYQSIDRYKVQYDIATVGTNKVIGANEPDVIIDYQYYVDNPDMWDATFTQAFIWYLSSEIALPIVGGDTGRYMRRDALKLYQELIAEALATDANERYRKPVESEITVARY